MGLAKGWKVLGFLDKELHVVVSSINFLGAVIGVFSSVFPGVLAEVHDGAQRGVPLTLLCRPRLEYLCRIKKSNGDNTHHFAFVCE
ncbi:hypothetical protein OIU78_029468 [Salix suchowensis]|nr:hypothetical protein OIU78_029468 [Salix suchowensis]